MRNEKRFSKAFPSQGGKVPPKGADEGATPVWGATTRRAHRFQ